jgi:alpha-1,2-mannosyltransferase
MSLRLRRWHIEAAAIAAALITFGVMASQLGGGSGLLLGNKMPVFGDFIAFWSAGRIVLDGNVALLHDAQTIVNAHAQAVQGLESYFPWRSAPPFLFVATPLALLPYTAAAVLFLSGCLAIYAFGMRQILPDWRWVIVAATTPTVVFHFGSIQLGLWVTGFSALAFAFLDKRPVLAGAAISMLIVKPHLAVLWPVLLAIQGRWRAFIAAGAFTALWLIAAGMVFTWEEYLRFWADLAHAQSFISERRLPPNTPGSLYGNLVYLGVSNAAAMTAQLISAALALAMAISIFMRNERDTSMAALAAATMLLSPYLFFYDTLLLAIGVAALAPTRTAWHDRLVFAAAFLAGAATLWVGYFFTPPICWAVSWALLATAFFRPRAARPTETSAALPA